MYTQYVSSVNISMAYVPNKQLADHFVRLSVICSDYDNYLFFKIYMYTIRKFISIAENIAYENNDRYNLHIVCNLLKLKLYVGCDFLWIIRIQGLN